MIGTVVQFLHPRARFGDDYVLSRSRGAWQIESWNAAQLGRRPTLAELRTVAQSQAFQDWLAERTDPVRKVRRTAGDWLQSAESDATATRALAVVLLELAQQLIGKVNELAALSPSVSPLADFAIDDLAGQLAATLADLAGPHHNFIDHGEL